MTSGNRIAIVGAGIAGLACAKVLSREGFAVEVFDRAPDVGGVWSATRRYPGLRLQNSKLTYHFSDFPMPEEYPAVPDGAQVQAYLERYARNFGLHEFLRLGTEVVAADPVDSGWLLEIRDEAGVHRTSCDHLLVANGVFSEPAVPDYRGVDAFTAAGGAVVHSSRFLDLESARGKNVVVVGYGQSACDIAEAVSHVAASTTVVARRLLWKMPRSLGRGLEFERLFLSRLGEAHFRYHAPRGAERFLHGAGRSFRDSDFDVVQELTIKRLGLRELDLVPEGRFEEIAQSTTSVVTEGFFEQVRAGAIRVLRDIEVAELSGRPGPPAAHLTDGSALHADLVVAATGFHQRVGFLTPYIQRQFTDEDGNFRLHRNILPTEVDNITFAGYNSGLLAPLTAEVTAHWIAAHLSGRLTLPDAEQREARIDERLRWMTAGTGGHHAHGTTVTPFTLHTIDELLADLKFKVPLRSRSAQWARRVRPGSYRGLGERHGKGKEPVETPPSEETPPTGGRPNPGQEVLPSAEQPNPPAPQPYPEQAPPAQPPDYPAQPPSYPAQRQSYPPQPSFPAQQRFTGAAQQPAAAPRQQYPPQHYPARPQYPAQRR
ncbi:flavin-containing monooxygenase [Nocardia higoensis]|uniref:flavin-containing monooxygenase n=1 Tax=Nocardia higoensis TaxID=228599 RepID=UPI0002F3E995|nr:NAD(P)/FAD-dependent oxidoreductase [Nocardia higoensis]